MMKKIIIILFITLIAACSGEEENWFCKIDGQTMYSVNSEGNIGSADKGCTCASMRSFERKVFGEVDEVALKSDFDC